MSPGLCSAVLFDFDGLVADSEPIHVRTWLDALREHGIGISETEYCDHWIRRGLGIGEFVQSRGLPHDPAALLSAKQRRYVAAVATDLRPMPGALELVHALKPSTSVALVSSGRRAMVEAALRAVGAAGLFEIVITHESVERRKPAPDCFLLAARVLGAAPERCVVLEDAEKGVLAAAAAGMPCIAVPTPHTRDHDFSTAALVVPSLESVTPAVIASVAARAAPR